MRSARVLAAAVTADLATGSRFGLTARAGGAFEKQTLLPPSSAMPADVYRPARAPRMALLLLHGLTGEGKDDARLRPIAEAFARAGVLVVAPDVASFRAQRLRGGDAEAASDALRTALTVAGAGLPFAAAGLSYAAGPLIVAASRPEFRSRVAALAAFGGFWDLRDVFVYAFTGRHQFLGERYSVQPHPFLRRIAAEFLLDRFEGEGRARLEALVGAGRDAAAAAASDRALSEKSRWFARALAEEDPLRVVDHIRKIDNGLLLDMWKVSPASIAPDIPGRVILAHSVTDPVIPFTQSKKLHLAVAARGPADLALLRGWVDGDPSSTPAGFGGAGSLAVYRVMKGLLSLPAAPPSS